MTSLGFVAAALLLAAGPAYAAGTCEDNFGTKGDPRNGAEYFTFTDIPDLSVAGALGQLRAIATADGFKVLNEESTANKGAMTLEQTASWKSRGFLIYLTAAFKGASTEVGIQTRLNRGQTVKLDAMRAEMCGMLAKIKAGSEGEAAGATARKTLAPPAELIDIAPIKLAREIDRQAKRDSPHTINERYKTKTYRLDGQISQVSAEGDGLWVWYDVVREGNILIPGESIGAQFGRTNVICIMSPDEADKVAGLRPDDYATLAGTFKEFNGKQFFLSNCRVAEGKPKGK